MSFEVRGDRERLLGVPEKRLFGGRLELREDKGSGQYILEGYASTYDPYDVHGGPGAGGWVEQLSMSAFDSTLAAQPDVQLLINHAGEPLARTKSGTLKLSRDGHGLRVWASLDPSDPDVQRIAPKMRRGDMDEMSFAFRVSEQEWDTSYSHRTIKQVNLEKGDVSVVNYGMNPTTKAVISDAVGALSRLSTKELVELRNLDAGELRRAAKVLSSIAYPVQAGTVRLRPIPKNNQLKAGVQLSPDQVRAKDDSKYGDVKYADPGYKSDGKKRYPINNKERAKAAWSYINMPKNHAGYTAAQVSAIKGRIKAALKEFGVTVGDDKAAASLHHIEPVRRGDGSTVMVAVLRDGSWVPLPTRRTKSGDFKDEWYGEWSPNTAPEDPHEEPYEEGVGKPSLGPVPANIVGGPLKKNDETVNLDTNEDVHNISGLDIEEMLAMDSHDDPYDVGPQVGSVPGDRPNVGDFPQGKVADNIIVDGNGPSNGFGPPVLGHPDVGTAPVVEGDGEMYDWTGAPIGGDSPAEDLNCDPVRPGIGMRSGDWAPTNIMASGDWSAYDPETGECSMDGEECDDSGDVAVDAPVELDLCLASALDKTIVHAYNLAKDNTELRKLLVVARRQLNSMRNVVPAATSEISRKLAELRKEVGEPDAGTVTDGLKWLRSAGSAPVGYRGQLVTHPDLHVTTPAERLTKEATEKAERSRAAAKDAEKAAERLKTATREAELNDVIRRHQKKA